MALTVKDLSIINEALVYLGLTLEDTDPGNNLRWEFQKSYGNPEKILTDTRRRVLNEIQRRGSQHER